MDPISMLEQERGGFMAFDKYLQRIFRTGGMDNDAAVELAEQLQSLQDQIDALDTRVEGLETA